MVDVAVLDQRVPSLWFLLVAVLVAGACGQSSPSAPSPIPCESQIVVGSPFRLSPEDFIDNLRYQSFFDVVRAGGKLWLAYSIQNNDDRGKVFLRTIGCDGTLGSPVEFSDRNDFAILPALASNDEVVAMTWTAAPSEYRFSSWDAVTEEPLADAVTTLGGAGNSAADGSHRFGFVAALPDGDFVVSGAMESGDTPHGVIQRVTSEGAPSSEVVTVSTSSYTGPRLTSDDDSILTAWEAPDTRAPSVARYDADLRSDPEPIFGPSLPTVGWGNWDTVGQVAMYAYTEADDYYGRTSIRDANTGAEQPIYVQGSGLDVALNGHGGAVVYMRPDPDSILVRRQVVVRLFRYENQVFTIFPATVVDTDVGLIPAKIVYLEQGVYFVAWTVPGDFASDNFLMGQFLQLDTTNVQ